MMIFIKQNLSQDSIPIPSGKLTYLWEITIFNGRYFNGHSFNSYVTKIAQRATWGLTGRGGHWVAGRYTGEKMLPKALRDRR